jgi:hypothetical protein
MCNLIIIILNMAHIVSALRVIINSLKPTDTHCAVGEGCSSSKYCASGSSLNKNDICTLSDLETNSNNASSQTFTPQTYTPPIKSTPAAHNSSIYVPTFVALNTNVCQPMPAYAYTPGMRDLSFLGWSTQPYKY